MHNIIKSLLGIKQYPPVTIMLESPPCANFASMGAREHVNYKRFIAVCKLLNLETREFNFGYQVRCANKEKRFDYYPTTDKGSWTGSNEFFKVESIENFLFINFKNV